MDAIQYAARESRRALERDADKRRIAELEAALDDILMAHALPGHHCEMEQAIGRAQKLISKSIT